MPSPKENCPLCNGLGFIPTLKGVKKCECIYNNFNLNEYLNIPKKFHDIEIQNVLKEIYKKYKIKDERLV